MARIIPVRPPISLPGFTVSGSDRNHITGSGGLILPSALVSGAAVQDGSIFVDFASITENPYVGNGQWRGGSTYFEDWQDLRAGTGSIHGINPSDSTYDDGLMAWDTGSPDHYVEAEIYRAPGYSPSENHEVQVFTRCDGTAGFCQLIENIWAWNHDYMQLVEWLGVMGDLDFGHSYTGAGPGAFPADHDIFRVESLGNNHRVLVNGVQVYTFTLSDYNTHTWAGIMTFFRTGATAASFGFRTVRIGAL